MNDIGAIGGLRRGQASLVEPGAKIWSRQRKLCELTVSQLTRPP